MKGNVNRLFNFFLLGFLALIFQLAYWQVVASSFLESNPANPRVWELERNIWRGGIYDRYGEILALSKDDEGRIYPLENKGFHIIGYNSRKYGKAGLESSYNRELLGLDNSNIIADFFNKILGRRKRGEDLVLTLDSNIQRKAYDALGSHKGAVVVLKPKTGEILALVSKPSVNPEEISKEWDKLNINSDSPLLNRATQGLYPPGSTFKILIAGVALEKGITKPEEVFFCPGYTEVEDKKIFCYNHIAHGNITLSRAMALSCNVTFTKLGIRLGDQGLDSYIKGLDWSVDHSLGLSMAKSNLLGGQHLSKKEVVQRSIGQGAVLTTPLYMACLISSVANDGVLMRPYLVSEIRDGAGHVIRKNKPKELNQIFTPTVAKELAKMLQGVVEDGTGRQTKLEGLDIAGKTGTAENPHGQPHAWFMGFAPLDNPEIAIVVVVENGGTGGAVAAPIARELFLNAFEKK